ncbi:RNA polymerase sigma factor [Embleya sp. NPDC020630]|uniref:RNA polymerase sigma factor n=1 Tax=Embleya sp. NPDC020630 TaxID=3363979 RepID=UPI00378B3E3C
MSPPNSDKKTHVCELSPEQLAACEDLHIRMVGSLTRRLIGAWSLSEADAEDIVQQAFVKLLRVWPTIRPSTAEAYVRRIADNLALSLFRRRKTERKANGAWLDNNRCVSTSPDLDAKLADVLTYAIDGLSAGQRAVLAYQRDGMDDSLIAQQMAIAPATVRSHRRKAIPQVREAVQRRLANNGEQEG